MKTLSWPKRSQRAPASKTQSWQILPQKERKSMSFTLIVIGAAVLMAFVVSAVQFAKDQAVSRCLRLIGSAFLLVVVASHLAEKFQCSPG
jgi:hypothetical protein